MPSKKDVDERQDYHVVSLNDSTDDKAIYDKLSHSKFYKDKQGNKIQVAQRWKDLVQQELDSKRSRFYRNYKQFDKQTSSGLSKVLEDVANSSPQSGTAVFGNAIDEERLKELFPNYTTTEDPLSDENKLRIHEAIQADGSVRRGLSFWRKFLLGRKVNVSFRLRKADLLADDVVDVITKRIEMHPDLVKYKSKLRDIDEEVQLREAIQSICDNLFGYGRAALVMLFNENQIPVRLVSLSSYEFGRVFIDADTFEFLGVEYLEIGDKANILLASDMIYFPINDNNVTPNSRFYGSSQIYPILSVAENNLINRERNFPEIIRKRWAATLLIKTATRSTARNQAIVDEVNNKAGGSLVIPDLVDAKNIQVDTELDSLINYSIEADKKILRDMELPMSAGGFLSTEVTRAAAQSELHIWSESTLEDLREMITDILVKQWYYPNLVKIVEQDVIENGTETDFTPAPIFDPTYQEEQDEENPRPTSTLEEQQNITAQQQTGQPTDQSTEQTGQSTDQDDGLSILDKLGFDINQMDQLNKIKERPSEDQLKQMVLEKMTNIAVDIYQDLVKLSKDDIISLTGEMKLPFEIFLKFENIIFDNFLDRSAGVLGIRSSGIINDDIALELMNLDEYIPRMRQEKIEKQKKKIEELEKRLEEQANGNGMMPTNNQPPQLQNYQIEKNVEEEVDAKNAANPTDAGIAAKNKISGRLAQRTNRGRVSG